MCVYKCACVCVITSNLFNKFLGEISVVQLSLGNTSFCHCLELSFRDLTR
eukprot:m.256961 g.256961  ORF g.256961 m.256961 type:complete len:50 (+) comp34876_c0_seq1:258-407(+)